MIRSLAFATLLALAAAVPAEPLRAAPSPEDRKTLVIRGRVTDPEGWPVPNARIAASGSARATTTSDQDGAYVLLVPVGSLEQLAKREFAVVVDVERRGWRFSLPGGDRRLGFALGLEAGGAGPARARVRSNEPAAASAVAEALVLDGNASALVEMHFVGVEGGFVPARDPELDAVEVVTIAGLALGRAAPPASAPAVALPKAAAPAGREARASAKPPAAARGPAAAAPEGAPAARSSGASARAEAPDTAAASRPPATSVPPPDPPLPARAETPDTAAAARPPAASVPAPDPPAPARAEAPDTAAAPRALATTVPPPAPPARDEPPARVEPPAPAPRPVLREPPPAPAAVGAPAPPAGAPSAPAAGGAATDDEAFRRVHPGQKPIDEATADLRPTTPPILYPQPPLTRPAPEEPPSVECACRIYGTVEVFAERPLPEPTRFVVSLRGRPAVRDTVELFMGSPRAFDFRGVPCGAYELDIRTIATRRFALTSRDGQAPVACTRDGQRHLRIVLEPR